MVGQSYEAEVVPIPKNGWWYISTWQTFQAVWVGNFAGMNLNYESLIAMAPKVTPRIAR